MTGIAQQIRRILQGIALDHPVEFLQKQVHVVAVGQRMVQSDAGRQVYMLAAHLQFAIADLWHAWVFLTDGESMFHSPESKPGECGHVQQVYTLVAIKEPGAFLYFGDDAGTLGAEIGQVFHEREVGKSDLLIIL